jgi:hypothetical protein
MQNPRSMIRAALPPSLKRWTPWVFALALLLKAAVPLLATAAAHAQGKTLVEVCTVYGVATVAVDDASTQPGTPDGPGHAGTHAGDHCVLSGVLLGAALGTCASAVALHAPERAASPPPAPRLALPPDACADWVARLKHGPPSLT